MLVSLDYVAGCVCGSQPPALCIITPPLCSPQDAEAGADASDVVIIFPSLEWDVGISGGVLQFPADVPGLLDLWWEDETPPPPQLFLGL